MDESRTAEAVRRARLAELDDVVLRRPAAVSSPRLRAGMEALADRLRVAHAHCHAVDEARWSRYVAELDSGLGELATEVERAAQASQAGPGVDASGERVEEILHARATALELAGWKLRMEALVAHADRVLTEAGRAPSAPAVREDVEHALDLLRPRV